MCYNVDKLIQSNKFKSFEVIIIVLLKVLSSHSNWGVRLDSFYPMLKSRCPAIKKKKFNDTISREEHKTN